MHLVSQRTSKRVVVIGAGLGGLGAAARLAASGHRVSVLERRDALGGRAYVYRQDGFTFDGGPTIITAPQLIDAIFEKAGRRRQDYLELVRCDPYYRIFDDTGRRFDYNGDEAFVLSEIDKVAPDDKEGYRTFVRNAGKIYRKGFEELADKPFDTVWDMLRVAPDLIRLQSYKSVYRYVSQFVRDPFLRQVFSFHPLLVGGNPFDTPSIYAMIHYLERAWGVWYAMGGTGALVDALARLVTDLGGTIHTDADVAEILVKPGARGARATGVRLADGRVFEADAVVSNADVAFTYRNLVDPRYRRKYTDRRLERMRYAMSLFVIYFGTDRRYAGGPLAHHNILLGKRYRGLLQDIFRNDGHLPEDFSLYLHMPTATDPSLAPPGHESFYVLSPVPNLASGIDWRTQARPYRDAIMRFLEERYLPGLSDHLVTEHWIDPLHFQGSLNAYQGSAFSFEPTLTQSAWFRPHNRSEDVDGLYFVGAGTHPGAGIPGVLSSAKIVDDLIAGAPATAGSVWPRPAPA